jgi:hypothetical protein
MLLYHRFKGGRPREEFRTKRPFCHRDAMGLPSTFLQLLAAMGASMTLPSLLSLVTVVRGWVFAGRRTLTGVLVAPQTAPQSTSRPTNGCLRRRAGAWTR